LDVRCKLIGSKVQKCVLCDFT